MDYVWDCCLTVNTMDVCKYSRYLGYENRFSLIIQ